MWFKFDLIPTENETIIGKLYKKKSSIAADGYIMLLQLNVHLELCFSMRKRYVKIFSHKSVTFSVNNKILYRRVTVIKEIVRVHNKGTISMV